MCLPNLVEINKIPAELLACKVSPQNYPSVLCGTGLGAKTRRNFDCMKLQEDLVPLFQIYRDDRRGQKFLGEVVGFTLHYNLCKYLGLKVFLTYLLEHLTV